MAYGLQVSNANGFVQIDGEKQGYALYDNYRIKLKNPGGITGSFTVYVPKLSQDEQSPTDMAVIRMDTANAEVNFSVENSADETDAFGNVLASSTLIGIAPYGDVSTVVDMRISIFRPVNALQLQAQPGDWGIEVFDSDGNLAFDNRQYSVAVDGVVSGNFANSSSKTVQGEALLGNTLHSMLDDVDASESRVILAKRVGGSYELRATDFDGNTANFGGGFYSFVGTQLPPNQVYEFISLSRFSSGNTSGTVAPGRYEAGYSSPEGIGSFDNGNNPPGATWARVMFISTDDGASEGSNKKGAWKITITGEWPEDRLKYVAFNAGFIGVYRVGQDSGSGGTYRYSVGGGLTTWSWGLNSVGDPENTEPNWIPTFFNYLPFAINARWNTENTD